PPRPGTGLGLAAGRRDARSARAVRRPALARDEAPARPLRQLVGPRPRAERPPPRSRRAPAGPPASDRPPRRRRRPHPRGRGGASRGADADGAKALGGSAGAPAELPE